MLLGFKRRFAPFVEDGTKTHTIRSERKITPRVGEMCHCYVDPRQKTMRLLGRWPCVRVEEIAIDWLAVHDGMTLLIAVAGQELDEGESNALAFRDGFRTNGLSGALDEMHAYWHKLHGASAFPFRGHLIHWERSR